MVPRWKLRGTAQSLERHRTGAVPCDVLADYRVDPVALADLGDVGVQVPFCYGAEPAEYRVAPTRVRRVGNIFEEHRTHLLGVAYRLTGSLADAEDAVQESWLRLARLPDADRAAIRDPRGWLTTVIGRLCLDRLRSAAVRRESYVGPWLPEPLVTHLDGPPDPLDEVVRDEGVRIAALVVLDRLTPEQRVAFVLHDALSVPFAEIADVLACSVPAARQHASRARRGW